MKPFPPLPRGATARSLALQVLLEGHRHGAFVQELLNHYLTASALAPPDRRLAAQLAYGVLRRRSTLDALSAPFIARPLGPGKENVREVLRLGALQLVLLDNIPVHAATHSTVGLIDTPRMRGFVNAVLRNVAALRTGDLLPGPAVDALPLEDGRYRRLSRAVLPSPEAHPVEYLAAAFALPEWLAKRWLERHGWEEAVRLGQWFIATPPLWLRVNPLRTDRVALLAALAAAGVAAEPGEHPQAIRLAGHANIRELPGYAEGHFAVQDASAMKVASALAPAPGSLVLDLCAAPGSKTCHLAELMRNQGGILACDIDAVRLETVREQSRRLGVSIIETHPLTLGQEDPPAGPFDAILVDAPCSNMGVVGRRPEVRWRLRERELSELARLQTRLLTLALSRLKPGGRLVYSTCSVEPEENQQLVRSVLDVTPGLALEQDEEQHPGRPADGGYWARLVRTASGGRL
jgi:16S rRNA (cytosine967-C5)-methyltransferase